MSVVPVDVTQDPGSTAHTIEVWDLPLRIFHWSLVFAFAAAFVTGKFGGSNWAQWHGRIGEFILGLLIFRVVWGLIGPPHARFLNFLPTLPRVRAYLSGRWHGHGHNPLGALSVIALLLLVGAQVATGLFANDDISFAGPWSDWIGKNTSDSLTAWHQDLFYVLAAFIALHVVAVFVYLLVRRTNLILPMITGRKPADTSERAVSVKWLFSRFAVAVTIAVSLTVPIFHFDSTPQAEAAEAPTVTPDW